MSNSTKSLENLQRDLPYSEKTITQSIKSLKEKNLLIFDLNQKMNFLPKPPYSLFLRELHFIAQTFNQMQKSLPKTLKQQLKHIEEGEVSHKKMEDYSKYLDNLKHILPEQIKKHYERYHEVLKKSEIFDKLKDRIEELKEIVPKSASKITEELREPNSFIKKMEKKLSKQIEDEFKLGISNIVAKIYYELINEHLGEITRKYTKQFNQIIHDFSSELLIEIKELNESVKEISTDIDIAFIAMETGTKALLTDLEKRFNSVHKEIDEKISILSKKFDIAIIKSFNYGTMKEILKFIELSERSLKEFSKEFIP
ncbi:MAG: hypothetical protein ACTSR8_19660 [Promethearchaeota archaeon]